MDLGTLTTRDHKVYENAKIVGVDALGVKVAHDAGSARVPFVRLPRELADQFQVKPGAAAAQRRKEAELAYTHEREVTRGLAAAADQIPMDPAAVKAALPAEMRSTTFEAMLEPRDTKAGARIAYLEEFIEQSYRMIDASEKEIYRQSVLATAAFNRGKLEEDADVRSRVHSNTRPSRDYPGLREGDRINQWITREKEQIEAAKELIEKAAKEIRSLRKSSIPTD